MSNDNGHVTTGKFYTSARKVQQLLGTLPDGRRIPGGPYTLTQVLAGLTAGVLAMVLRPLWSQGVLSDTVIIVLVVAGVGYLAGKIPRTRRSPITLINGVLNLITRPTTGRYRGRTIPKTFTRTKKAKNTAAESATDTEPEQDQTRPSERPAEVTQVNSGLERLLADTAAK